MVAASQKGEQDADLLGGRRDDVTRTRNRPQKSIPVLRRQTADDVPESIAVPRVDCEIGDVPEIVKTG